MSLHVRTTRTDRSSRDNSVPRVAAPLASLRALDAAEQRIEAELRERFPDADLTKVGEAYRFAREAHGPQRRASGEPYITHPLAVAQILSELGLDPLAVQAALLHDVPEDTEYYISDVEERFGSEVAHLVDGVTKLSKFSARSHEEQQAENIRKMFLAMAEDIRVVLIKLADRLHNMRTLGALPVEKQQRIARQTAEIYAPLAERLGIWQFKWELEDLCFKALEPDAYRGLASQLESRRRAREAYVKRAMEVLGESLAEAGIEAELSGRPKHIYSIHRKMQRKSAALGEIYDIHAVRVLVDSVRDCYGALGVVHALWRPDPGPVRRLHRDAQEQRLPEPPHRGRGGGRQAARGPDPDPRDASHLGGGHRGPLALQGGLAHRPSL